MTYLFAAALAFSVLMLIVTIAEAQVEKLLLLELLHGGVGYGLSLSGRIKAVTGRRVWLSTVYPCLRSLEQRGLVESWDQADELGIRGGRTRKMYRITRAGEVLAKSITERSLR